MYSKRFGDGRHQFAHKKMDFDSTFTSFMTSHSTLSNKEISTMTIHRVTASRDGNSISSLSSEEDVAQMSTATRTTIPPTDLRSGVRAENLVHAESAHHLRIDAKDIVKIFTADKEYTEVSLEQVQRVKKSTCYNTQVSFGLAH